MANRHLSRSVALQSLFEWDFHRYDKSKIKELVAYNIEEFAPGLSDEKYALSLTQGILTKQGTLDAVIEKAAPEWPLDKISNVDRNVLRIGLYELLFSDRKEVPPKVAINEAIELAKAFGGENSGKFVNGVLGTVYKEMGEPGKNESSKKTEDPQKMPKELLAGAVVFKNGKDGKVYLAFVHDVFGYWTLSKGHLDKDEEVIAGAKREIKEELNIDVEILDTIGENEYTASDPEKGKIRKHVYYFLARAVKDTLKLQKEGGLDDARWFALKEVPDLKVYGDMLPIITKGIGTITKKYL
jgi:transcription antitermination protein NusB